MLSAVLLLAIIAVLVTSKQNGNAITCKNGHNMNSISNSFINGVRVEHYNGNGGSSRPMTKAEREQFDKYMKQFNQQMQSSMHNLPQTLAKDPGSLNQNLANGFLQRPTADLNNTDCKRTVGYKMLFAVLLLAIIAVLVRSKQYIDCLEGQGECKNASNYILDGKAIKCCKNGCSMNNISSSFMNGVRVEYCKCTRYNGNGGSSRPITEAEREQFDKSMKQFNHQMQSSMHNMRQTLAKNLGSLKQNLANGFLQGLSADLNNIDIDCLEGQEECKNASNYILDGKAIKYCKNGYSMNSISNSFMNGVRVEYCKCTRYNGNDGFSRPMTEAEREQFDKSMKQFNHQMQSSMHNMRQTLAKNLGSLKQNLANGFLQGMNADINNIDLPPEQ